MELYRKIYDHLIEWKNKSQGKSALLIEGARRIGKSTIAEKFGKEQYKSYIVIDFARSSKNTHDNFNDNINNLDIFFQNLSLEYNTRLYNRESLIIFDEIQRFPKAREAIKYLVKDGRYDYLETGSLISINENVKDIVLPSEEDHISMYPLDFEEFLIAADEELLLEHIKTSYLNLQPLSDALHRRANRLFREYILVGGMPQSVVAYFENNRDFYEADIVKRRIINLYKDDINKAARKYYSKVSAIFDNIPGYLSRHDKKVVLSILDNGRTFSEYDAPIFWLEDSMICNMCYKCNDPNVGLSLNKDNTSVKCYMGDTGLLVSLAFSENEISDNELYKKIMNGNLNLNEGMFHENVMAQTITAYGKKLYFYTHYSDEKHRNDIEIDFLISNGSKTNYRITPVEVKSSKNYTNSSYDSFKNRFGKRIGKSYIVHPKQLSVDEKGIKIPSYMFFCTFID